MYSYNIIFLIAMGLVIPFNGQVEGAPQTPPKQLVDKPIKMEIEESEGSNTLETKIKEESFTGVDKSMIKMEIEEAEGSTSKKLETEIKEEDLAGFMDPEDEMREIKEVLSRNSTPSRRGSRKLTKEEEEDMRQAFAVFDIDGNGVITVEELKKTLVKIGEDPGSDADVQEMIDSIDQDGNGTIDYDEFLAMMTKENNNADGELRRVFDMMDKNHDGFITGDELRVTGLFEESEIKTAIETADQNGDGKIDFNEFKAVLMYLGNNSGSQG